MKRALVLSGGGANGAFQFGALKYIEEQVKPRFAPYNFDLIAGVSVGAVNGVMIAMEKFMALEKLWNSPNLEKLVLRGRLSTFQVMRRLLSREKSFLDNRPLMQLLERYVKLADINFDKHELKVGAVSLRTGKFVAFRAREFDQDNEFRKAILSSTAIPLLWEPLSRIQTRDREEYDMVDGSIRDTSPLGHVIRDHPDEVIIINCSSRKLPMVPDELAASSLFSIARRALVDIAIDEIFINDLREFLTINELVGQAKAQKADIKLFRKSAQSGEIFELKQFQTILIEPTAHMGSLLDFSPESVQWRIQQGYEAASKAFARYKGEETGELYSSLG